MCKVRTRAMVLALKLETQAQYGMRDDQYEVLKSSACLQGRNYAFTFKPGFSLHCQQPRIEAVLLLPFSFSLCRKVEAVTLNFGLLAEQSQEERTKKRGSPLPCSPVLHKTQTRIPAPSISDAVWLSLQRIQNETENQGIWTVKMDFVPILCKIVPAWAVFSCYLGLKCFFLLSTIFWCYYKEAVTIFSSLTSSYSKISK